VVLHRVGPGGQGPLDSLVAPGDGTFRFRTRVDSGDVLLVSGRWHGVEYFAAPAVPGSATLLVVTDTSARAPIRVAARHIIIGGPAADGARDVVDLIVLRNDGTHTRVSPDTSAGTWSLPLPPLVANLGVGDADFARDAFDVHDDSLHLFAPIPPGDRQFFLQYQLAPGARSLDVPLVLTDTISVLAEEADLDLPAAMVPQGSEEMQGRRFTRWSGGGAMTALRIDFPERGVAPGWLLPALVLLVAIPLAWASRRAFARSR
jgi:hypothetical protein